MWWLALAASASTAGTVSTGSAVDEAGNIYVAGRFTGTLSEGGTRIASVGGSDVFLMKLAPDGAALWVRGFGGPGDDSADSVSVTDQGLVVTGTSGGSLTFGADTWPTAGMFVARLDPDGTAIWSRTFASEETTAPAVVDVGQLRVLLIAGGWANVWVNGRKLEDLAPLASYALSPGTYEVRLENPFSGLVVNETIEVEPGETTTVFGRRW